MTDIERAYHFFTEYPGHLKTSRKDIANRLKVSPEDITEAKRLIREDNEPTFTDLDEFAQSSGFDPDDASMIWYKNKNLSVAVKKKALELDKQKLYEFLSQYDYESVKPDSNYRPKDSFAVLNLFDAHIDKLGYTGMGGYDEAKENAQYLLKYANILLQEILTYQPEVIILPIGNDFFNTNDANPATKKGTPQPYTMHWEDSFKLGVMFYRTLINMILETGCKVHAINIPGNHDKDKVFHLGEVISALYEDVKNVTLNMNKDKRKYVVQNKVLLGFAHGDVAKRKVTSLPTAMAIEQPKAWGEVNHRCWVLGDIHHKEEYSSLQTLEHNGVDIKFLRPATSADKWHTDQLWISAKKSISYMVYRDGGTRITNDELFI